MTRGRQTKARGAVRESRDRARAEKPATPEEIQELRRKVQQLTVFHEVGKALTSSLRLDHILKTIMQNVGTLVRPDTWSLLLVDDEKKELYFEIAVGANASKLKDVRLKIGQGLAGWSALHGKAVVVPDVDKDSRFCPEVDAVTSVQTRSVVCVPIKSKERVLGVIELVNCLGKGRMEERDIALLQAMADYAAIAIENARQLERIHELTLTDDCTTLYNARHLNAVLDAEISRSARYGYEFSLLFMDLDKFKEVNDTHGHLIGSKLLYEIGLRVKIHCRVIDYAFRYGGDEFVVLLPQTNKENAFIVARRLHRLLGETVFFKDEGLDIRITASIGLAAYPTDAKTKADLLRLADEAMYFVKNTSRNNVAAANYGLLVPRA